MTQSLLVRQLRDGKVVKSYRLVPGQSLTFGRDRNADVRTKEESAKILFREQDWYFKQGDRIKPLSPLMEFEGFDLKTEKIEQSSRLFGQSLENDGTHQVQLIVVKKGERLIHTEVLPLEKPYFDARYLSQPLAPGGVTDPAASSEYEVSSQITRIDRELPEGQSQDLPEKKVLLQAGAVVFALIMTFFATTFFSKDQSKPEDAVAQAQQLKANRFTKMIYDAKEFEQTQERVQDILKEKFDSDVAAPEQSVGENVRQPVKETLNKIQKKGISDLIGKIASQSVVSADSVKVKRNVAGSHLKSGLSQVSGKIKGMKKKPSGYRKAGVATASLVKNKGAIGKIGKLSKGRTGSSEVAVLEEETMVDGGLEPEVIAGVIRRHLGEVRYCYERQLSRANDLEGKVQLNFAIGSDGSVSWQKIGKTTLNNAMVEGCILRRVAKWKFPQPKGGTSVHVTYPFLLKSVN